MVANNSQNKDNNEIKHLREELNKSNKIIEKLNSKIKELEQRLQNENQIHLNKIKELEKNIKLKEKELNQLKMQIINTNFNNFNFNQPDNNFQNKDRCVNFSSVDQSINFAIPCSGNSTFAEVEELLYREYPELRETNNNFLANGFL